MEIKAEKVHKSYGTITVLDEVSFSLGKGEKIGLIGYNGTGKTTLLKIIAGLIEPDGGEIIKRKDCVVGYMPQDTSISSAETIKEYLKRISGIAELEERSPLSPEAMNEYERRDGYSFDHRMAAMLSGFGIDKDQHDKTINSLSSGQKSKVFMIGVLLSDPDVFLLDEPTNNLDLPALIWLEDFLSRTDAAALIVSHDRLFLDRVVKKIFEIDWHTRSLNITRGRYSDYLERKEKDRARQLAQHEAQQEEIGRLTEQARKKKAEAAQGSHFVGSDNDKFLRGFKRDRAGKSGKDAKAIEKRIEQMEVIEKPLERDVFRIPLDTDRPEGKKDISLRELVVGYPGNFQVGPLSATIPYGSKVVILGPNGSGKSTLLKTIGGTLSPIEGAVDIGRSLVIGNLMQEHDTLPRNKSIKEILIEKAGVSRERAFALATKFGFKAAEIEKVAGDLSPGGRARLLFAVLSSMSANTLLLDEPTNHLDLEALEALEEALSHYEGTVIVVSHDRYFLNKLHPTDTYLISSGKLTKQNSFEAYEAMAEKEAARLINML